MNTLLRMSMWFTTVGLAAVGLVATLAPRAARIRHRRRRGHHGPRHGARGARTCWRLRRACHR